MPIGRRPLLATGLAAAFGVAARGTLAAAVGDRRGDSFRALGPFVDALLPGDGLSPSATDLGIDARILRLTVSRPDFERLLVLGCGWLDSQARSSGAEDFAALAPADREALVARSETAPEETPPRRMFDAVHRLALIAYYGDSRSWPALGFSGPPQPVGFPDHDQPPE